MGYTTAGLNRFTQCRRASTPVRFSNLYRPRKGRLFREGVQTVAGDKQTIEIELNNDQVTFMRLMKDDYKIRDESKVFRIIMDYLQTNQEVHDSVFGQVRCLRCD